MSQGTVVAAAVLLLAAPLLCLRLPLTERQASAPHRDVTESYEDLHTLSKLNPTQNRGVAPNDPSPPLDLPTSYETNLQEILNSNEEKLWNKHPSKRHLVEIVPIGHKTKSNKALAYILPKSKDKDSDSSDRADNWRTKLEPSDSEEESDDSSGSISSEYHQTHTNTKKYYKGNKISRILHYLKSHYKSIDEMLKEISLDSEEGSDHQVHYVHRNPSKHKPNKHTFHKNKKNNSASNLPQTNESYDNKSNVTFGEITLKGYKPDNTRAADADHSQNSKEDTTVKNDIAQNYNSHLLDVISSHSNHTKHDSDNQHNDSNKQLIDDINDEEYNTPGTNSSTDYTKNELADDNLNWEVVINITEQSNDIVTATTTPDRESTTESEDIRDNSDANDLNDTEDTNNQPTLSPEVIRENDLQDHHLKQSEDSLIINQHKVSDHRIVENSNIPDSLLLVDYINSKPELDYNTMIQTESPAHSHIDDLTQTDSHSGDTSDKEYIYDYSDYETIESEPIEEYYIGINLDKHYGSSEPAGSSAESDDFSGDGNESTSTETESSEPQSNEFASEYTNELLGLDQAYGQVYLTEAETQYFDDLLTNTYTVDELSAGPASVDSDSDVLNTENNVKQDVKYTEDCCKNRKHGGSGSEDCGRKNYKLTFLFNR